MVDMALHNLMFSAGSCFALMRVFRKMPWSVFPLDKNELSCAIVCCKCAIWFLSCKRAQLRDFRIFKVLLFFKVWGFLELNYVLH